jgi:membrane-associated phospholipid phosphatase
VYLAAIAMSLVAVIFIAMLLPALTPVAHLDRTVFHNIAFSGCTPVDVLLKLRASAPMRVVGDFGGILSFPSFHAVVGIMIPLVLRRTRLFPFLVLMNAALLSGTITEGGHYFCDVIAGGALAALSYWATARLQALEETRRGRWGAPIAAHDPALPIPAE